MDANRPAGQPATWHRFGLPCLKRANRDAPCLLCGGCITCCNCREKLAQATGATKVEKKAKDVLWTCPRCGVEVEFAMGHVMAGCEKAKEA